MILKIIPCVLSIGVMILQMIVHVEIAARRWCVMIQRPIDHHINHHWRFDRTNSCDSVLENRAVFKRLSKVITWLRLLRLVIGLKDSRQFFNQWEAKPKPIAPCTRDFSRALSEFQVIARNYHWLIRCLLLLWLVRVIDLVLVFRQSFENRSKNKEN